MKPTDLVIKSQSQPSPGCDSRIPILVIVGPTAVGKTSFSIQLAKISNAEIVSCDSRYFYRGMTIGTAKPTPEEMDNVPHHLIDVADPDETWSLATFQKAADMAIRDIVARGKNVIVVGGTGQYARAILEGWSPPEMATNEPLRAILDDWGREIGAWALYTKLQRIDPVAASNIEYQNMRRTIRALEVIFSTGRKFSDQRRVTTPPYRATVIGLTRDRSELYERIDRRIDNMIAGGLIAEVEALLAKGYGPDLPSMSAIGYREIAAVLRGEMTLDEAVTLIRRGTRTYVRRQANWFKLNDPTIHWLNYTMRETYE